ncbi:MAG: GtrA family protein [Casimicrobiaceae bacterium]
MTSQFLLFLVVGGIQIAVDALLFAIIFVLTGEPLVSNVVSRGSAAILGFLLNRRYTFDAWRVGEAGGQGLRYILLWVVLTAFSTSLIAGANAFLASGGNKWEWMVGFKVLIEAGLALLSFLGMRFGVFGRHEK